MREGQEHKQQKIKISTHKKKPCSTLGNKKKNKIRISHNQIRINLTSGLDQEQY